ncbi:MAG: hypothetical protein HON53_01940 [Planctomycetaceae bacterium]|nr:hypothetical protein [Planctomycetaceae bacterium]MBT6154993.1 hypothetical protein [Planctomycetaceae bacterium]MBT6487332.1 hypothetical protein [Planctomycetaceae bacterium]MBT6493046.1 hypothetical protein [Planctomycetaceae bacterium]
MSLHDDVCRILWEEWDPMGLRPFTDIPNEYGSYAETISRYILEGRDEFKMISHLQQLQRNAMGLSHVDNERDRRVARLLLSLGE